MWAQAERGPGRHSHTCTLSPDPQAIDRGVPAHSCTLVHTPATQALRQADPGGHSPPLSAFPPPPTPVSGDLSVPLRFLGTAGAAGEPQGGRQPGGPALPRAPPAVGWSRLGVGMHFLCTSPFISLLAIHSLVMCVLVLTAYQPLPWLLWSPSKIHRYPQLQGMESRAARAVAGWGLLGGCGKGTGGAWPALGMRKDFPEEMTSVLSLRTRRSWQAR